MKLYEARYQSLKMNQDVETDFYKEMVRFLPTSQFNILNQNGFWEVLSGIIEHYKKEIKKTSFS